MRKALFIFGVYFGLFLTSGAFTLPALPLSHVNDYANILSSDTKQNMEEDLRVYTATTSNEIAVVTIPDLGGDTVEHYATKLFETWKIGKAKNDNGVLLLIARDEHKIRIEVGYGLEGALPDILVKNIIDTEITPAFKQRNYDLGVTQGVKAIMEAARGEYTSQVLSTKKGNSSSELLMFMLIFGVQGLIFIVSVLGRSKSWWAGGILGGVIGVILTVFGVFGLTFVIGIIITIIFSIVGLILDYAVSKTYIKAVSQGSSIPWWIGGGGNGGGWGNSSSRGGGSSFGGFGGGSSGGGGASGNW